MPPRWQEVAVVGVGVVPFDHRLPDPPDLRLVPAVLPPAPIAPIPALVVPTPAPVVPTRRAGTTIGTMNLTPDAVPTVDQ